MLLRRDDRATLAALGHKLKGAAARCLRPSIDELASRLEKEASTQNSSEIETYAATQSVLH